MLTKPIPKELREEMSNDPFYKKCCIADETCSGILNWHHNLIFQGRRQNTKATILPVCKGHHDRADTKEIREKINWVMLNRMSDSEIDFYSKAIDYQQLKKYLNEKYGN